LYYDFERPGGTFVTGNIVVRSPSIVLRFGGASDGDMKLMRPSYYDFKHRSTIFANQIFSYKSQATL
jgi:hypothetical protein